MNKWIILLFICLVPGLLSAQKKTEDVPQDKQIKGLVIAGMNMSQVDGDQIAGYNKFGINAGVGAMLPLGKNFSLSLETLFNQKGSYSKYPPASDGLPLPYYRLRLDYLDVPVLVSYEDKHIVSFGIGFSWGRLVDYKEIVHGSDTTFSQYFYNGNIIHVAPGHVPGGDTTLRVYPLKKNDWDVIVNVYFRIWQHLKMNVRFSYSMVNFGYRDYIKPVSGSTWSRTLYNNVFSFRLMYILNERYVPPPREKKNKTKKINSSTPTWKS